MQAMEFIGANGSSSASREEAAPALPLPRIAVTCVLTHEMGHSEETTLEALPDTSGSKNSI